MDIKEINLEEIIERALDENGIALDNADGKKITALAGIAEHLIKANSVMNLTAITDPEDIAAWQPGDIVTFEGRHIGIISDKRNRDGIPYLIHNSGQPKREEDALLRCHRNHPISGHFRWNGGTKTD